jgi:hypothetical protein
MSKHIVCFSGGHSSAIVAIEVVRKFGAENVILLNHDIIVTSEDADVKRFKREVSEYLGLPITYANHSHWDTKDQFDVCVDAKSFVNPANRTILCTHRLKTQPFYNWISENHQDGDIYYYGMDANEPTRIVRRAAMMGKSGYETDFPLLTWKNRTITSTMQVGIARPQQYSKFAHANCIGCLKAGWQHWYIIFCEFPEIWQKAKWAEAEIGYSVHADGFFEDKEGVFSAMQAAGVPATEHIPSGRFWANAKKSALKASAGQVSLFDLPDSEPSFECMGDCGMVRGATT